MIRPLTLLSIVAAAGAGLHVYNTKHAVSLLDRELRAIAQDIQEAETRTQALQAEWSWATEQERLRALAQRHLAGLEPMQPTQFLRFAEAERRLPPPAVDDGSSALFAPGSEQVPGAAATRIALLPPEAPGGAASPMPMVAAAPHLLGDTLAAVAKAALAVAAERLPLPAPAAPELRPVSRNPIAFAPRPAEARAPEPRPAAVELARAAAPPPPRPVAPPPAPRPTIVASAAAAATPVARPPAPPPQVAAAPRPPAPAATQVAVASSAPPRASEAVTPLGSFGPGLGGGSTLGSARAALPPPVAYGSAGATLR